MCRFEALTEMVQFTAMLKSTILIITLSFSLISFCQANGIKEIRELTPAVLKDIKADIESKAIKFKSSLSTVDMTPEQIEFSVDTFKIEQIATRKIDIDYSTMGINNAVNDLTSSYDILLNKYYKKLLNSLNEEDKKVLIAAQRAWMIFRDAEAKLIWTMTNDEYSGGGTMQSNIATGSYSYLIKQRTIDIFSYYNDNLNKK